MKKAVSIVFIVCVVVVIILAFGHGAKGVPVPTSAPTTETGASAKQPAKGYTTLEVAKHASPTDCWLVIDGKVYDVTKYVTGSEHPAGSEAITPFCGKDATQAFDTKGKKRPQSHSQNAEKRLDTFYLGNLLTGI